MPNYFLSAKDSFLSDSFKNLEDLHDILSEYLRLESVTVGTIVELISRETNSSDYLSVSQYILELNAQGAKVWREMDETELDSLFKVESPFFDPTENIIFNVTEKYTLPANLGVNNRVIINEDRKREFFNNGSLYNPTKPTMFPNDLTYVQDLSELDQAMESLWNVRLNRIVEYIEVIKKFVNSLNEDPLHLFKKADVTKALLNKYSNPNYNLEADSLMLKAYFYRGSTNYSLGFFSIQKTASSPDEDDLNDDTLFSVHGKRLGHSNFSGMGYSYYSEEELTNGYKVSSTEGDDLLLQIDLCFDRSHFETGEFFTTILPRLNAYFVNEVSQKVALLEQEKTVLSAGFSYSAITQKFK